MTYPPARYSGQRGEVSATYRPASTEPDLTYASGGTADYLATGSTTDGLFGLYRWNMAAEPSGPRPHFHRTMAESFYILLGRVRIFDGTGWIETEPGDFVHVPPGGIHAFRNESGEPASMLIHFAPGAPREAYFEGLARWATEGRPDPDEADAFYREHDNLFD
jgi:mannose-6-phosphate isomerase-like protein (cupin superfamily)